MSVVQPDVSEIVQHLIASPKLDREPYARPNLYIFRPRHLIMARAIERHLEGRREAIADIGCHNGFFLRLSVELGFRRLVAVDYFELPPQESFLEGVGGVEFVKTNFNSDRFLNAVPDQSMDCVVSTEVLEHIYHYPLGYLQECWRVIRPGGLLLLSTPNPCTLVNAWRLAAGSTTSWGGVDFARTPKISNSNDPLAVWDIHFREYSPMELDEIVASLPGVQVVEKGFIATGIAPNSSLKKRLAKSLQSVFGLDRRRAFSTTQFQILRRGSS